MIMQDNEKKPALRFKGFTDPWEQRKLDELGTIVTGSTPSTTNDAYYADDGLLWVTPTDITKNITCESARKLSASGQKVARVVPRNTILVTCIASIGKNTMLANAGSFNQQINGLTPDENKYVPYFLLTESVLWSAKMKVLAATGTLQIINRTEFSEIKTFLPSFDEQKRISQYFEKLDTLITLHQRKYEKLVNIKKSMLDKMFPPNGVSVPEIRFKGFTDPWEQRKLDEIANFSKGVGYSKNDLCEEGTPIILYGRLYTKYETSIFDVDTFVKEKAGSVYSKGGEVIVPASGETAEDISIASVVVKPGILLGGDLNIVSPTTEYDSAFLALTISSGATHKYLSSLAQGKSVVHLHNADIQSVSAKFPTKREQEKIHLLFGKIDTLITLHQRKLEKLQNIKKSCLEKMFV